MKLIDKDALVAEIEKIEKALKNHCEPNPFGNMIECATAAELQILDLVKETIDTLEMKGVDLEKEIECSLPKPAWGWNEDYFGKSDPAYSMEQMKEFAKHFFELGVQQSKKYNNNEEKEIER